MSSNHSLQCHQRSHPLINNDRRCCIPSRVVNSSSSLHPRQNPHLQQRAATPTNLVGENKPAQVETPPNTSFMQQQGTPTAPSHGQHQQQQLSTPADSQGPQQPQFLIPGVQSQHGPLTPIKSEIGQYPRFVIPTNYSHSQSSTTSTSQSVLHSRFVIHANPSPDQQQPPTPTNSQHPKFAIPAQSPSAQHPSTTPTNSARPQFIIPSNPPIEQHAQPPSPAVSTRGQHPVFRIPSNSAPDQQNQQLPTALTTTPPRPRRRPIVPKHPVHAQAKRKPIPLSELVGKRPIPVLAKLSRLQRAFVFGPGGCGHVPPVPGDMGVKRMMAVQLPIVRRGELVDLWGPSGCGKTEMIMQMITMTILPESFTLLPSTSGGDSTPLHLHGSATPVLLLDCDLKFSLTKLRNTMLAHITHCLTTLTPALTSLPASTTDIIITSALHRLHIMRPTTNLQFLAALIAARRSFVRACGTPGPLIIIDGLTSYYWINRLDDMGELKAEVTGIPMEDEAEGHLRPAKSFMKSSIHWAVIRAVRRLRDLEHCGVVVSRGVLWPAGRKAGGRWGSNGSNNQKWNGNAPRKGGNAWTPKYADGPWKAVVNRFIVLRRKRASGEVVWYERE
ncbi:uncharacterized protein EV422DRAFT_388861 [Fimicolochytrium jonesii]|uniref:uncharacterized protein n=1 Tax=Fimicolochytrium jonesii TaxID=1396493 RepID=UPI0022FE9FC0|nr:uncharacterized protein EV422DRAFT_388861 [Fimicolochytrium jonesii]KAI8823027.1 hypothetical protein EV422DRAFT_388861 [Fimicolochytrium jonesii]